MTGPMDDDEIEGRSIEDAAMGNPPDELFPMGLLDGDNRTLSNLVKGSGATNVELKASISKAAVPLQGGLIDPHKSGRAIVHYEAASYKQVPTREDMGDGVKSIVSWSFVCELRPTYVQPLGTDEETIIALFERYMLANMQAASKLADRLQRLSARA